MLPAPRLRPRRLGALVAASACVVASGHLAAQTGCRFGAGSGTATIDEIPGAGSISRFGHPHFVCNDGVEIWADSAESRSMPNMQNMMHLMGHVRYVDSTRVLRADDARYFSQLARLQAFGHLFIRDTTRGSVIENGSLEYLRADSTRPQEQMTVVIGPDLVRPQAFLYMRPAPDTGASPDTSRTGPPDTTGAASADTTRAGRRDTTGVASADTTRAGRTDTTGVASADTTRAGRRDTTGVASADTTRAGRTDTTRVASPDTGRAEPPGTTGAASHDTTRAAPPDTGRAVAADTALVTPADTTATGPPPVVRGRPAGAPVTPPDTTPYLVEADRLLLRGESYFRAMGSVRIHRDSLHAFADTAEYEQDAGRIVLRGRARVQSSGYDLSGTVVDISAPGGEIDRVRALHSAKLNGNQLNMTAPVITVFMTNGQIDRLVATPLEEQEADSAGLSPTVAERPGLSPERTGRPAPPGPVGRRPDVLHVPPGTTAGAGQATDTTDQARPVANSDKFRITADSLDVRAPAQVLDKMYAVGDARGASSAGDSLNVPSLPDDARKDWIVGDTLIATFVKVEPKADQPHDSVHYDLDRLVSQGNARTLYRIASSDSTFRPGVDPPAVHYVGGDDITIVLDSGRVSHMDVVNPKGWHFEPLSRAARDSLAADSAAAADTAKARSDTAKARANPTKTRLDTLKARPDTSKVRPDTLKVRPDTMAAAMAWRIRGVPRQEIVDAPLPAPLGSGGSRASPRAWPAGRERRWIGRVR